MEFLVAAASAGGGVTLALAATTYGYGLRHGVDWDHIAAIGDITGSQQSPRQSLKFATLYAVGHGFVVFVLGVVAIVFAERLPDSVDGVMERVVGITLLVLGVYVFYGLLRYGRDFRMRSRWMLVLSGVRRLGRRFRREPVVVVEHVHAEDERGHRRASAGASDGDRSPAAVATPSRHRHRHIGTMPDDPFATYGPATSLGVGVLHGIGAETPTQVLLFLAAAGAGGRGAGVALLLCFLAGLITSNTAIAVVTTFGFLSSSGNFFVYAAVSVVIAVFSVALGLVYLLGDGAVLPEILST